LEVERPTNRADWQEGKRLIVGGFATPGGKNFKAIFCLLFAGLGKKYVAV
jgi:hypothetical protein